MSRIDRLHKWSVLAALLMVIAAVACSPSPSEPGALDPDAVQVDAPTGQAEVDRAVVQAALDGVPPGGTVQLAAGTYLLGAGVNLVVPDVTLQGHPDGTVLRGCDPEVMEFPAPPAEPNPMAIIQNCSGLYVLADRQTIRDLTIEYAWHGIFVGTPPWLPADENSSTSSSGGHTIENNLFRYTPNGVRVVGPAEQPTVIANNEVRNAFHAFQANGAAVHFLNNRISVPEPHAVPSSHHPESGVIVNTWGMEGHHCEGSRVEGNIIEGTVNGIQILADPGQTCTGHVIRDNEIRLGEVPLAGDYPDYLRDFFFGPGAVGSSATGTAIRLHGQPGSTPDEPAGRVTDVLVENNRLSGGFGLAVQLRNASSNRLVGNRITDIRRRDPFPGLTWGEDPTVWKDANGSAIWISAGSDLNQLEGNSFEGIEASAVMIQGDENEVTLGDEESKVEDRGQGNQIRRP